MFRKIPEPWREAIYYALFVALAILFVFRMVTPNTVLSAVSDAANVMSAIALLMAGENTNKR